MDRMNSIAPECNELKHKYDDCFHQWYVGEWSHEIHFTFALRFTTVFLANKHGNSDPCAEILKQYQTCTKQVRMRFHFSPTFTHCRHSNVKA
jgi:hypothetical protein